MPTIAEVPVVETEGGLGTGWPVEKEWTLRTFLFLGGKWTQMQTA